MVIERGPVPVWRQLAALLRQRIESGEYQPGMPVPSITRLAAEHDLAEGTVRKALDALKEEGYLTGVPGLGTFVSERFWRGLQVAHDPGSADDVDDLDRDAEHAVTILGDALLRVVFRVITIGISLCADPVVVAAGHQPPRVPRAADEWVCRAEDGIQMRKHARLAWFAHRIPGPYGGG